MKTKLLSATIAIVALTHFTGALKVEELSLNRSTESANLQIYQNELTNELSNHYLSTDINETYYNLRDKEVKNVIDRLPWPETASVNAFYHQLAMDKLLGFKAEPKKISLLEIIERNNPNTENVNSNESYMKLLRGYYNKMFNDYYSISVDSKKGSSVGFLLQNNSKFNIKGVMFNVRLLDKNTGAVVLDEVVKKSLLTKLKPNYEMKISNYFDSNNPEWDKRAEDELVWKIDTLAVTLEDGRYINIDDLYEMQTKKQRELYEKL